MVSQERHRNDQRHVPEPVIVNQLCQFGSRSRIEALLQMPGCVLQHVGVACASRYSRESSHEDILIRLSDFFARPLLDGSDEGAEFAVVLETVRHQLEFVGGVKHDELPPRPAPAKQIAQSLVREHPFDEILAKLRVVQSAFFFDREVRRTYLLPFTRESSKDRRALWKLCERLSAEPSR